MAPDRSEELEEQELLDYLLIEADVGRACDGPKPRRVGEPVPLSFAQQRLWSLQAANPSSPAYTISESVRLCGKFDPGVFRLALYELVARHESLRAFFPTEDGIPVVRISPDPQLDFSIDDLSHIRLDAREGRLREEVSAAARLVFDLAQPPLLRVKLFRIAENEHALVVAMHHIVSDGWSMSILISELSALYAALSAGAPHALPPLSIQYSDFAIWQRSRHQEFETQLDYWRHKLHGLADLELKHDLPRPKVATFEGSAVPLEIPTALAASLRSLSQRCNASLFMTLLAGFEGLLHRYTGQADIPVGTPVANRNRKEIEPLIGFFVNTLVIRGDFSGQPTFVEAIQRIRDTALEAFSHQDIPFEQVVQALTSRRSPARNPLFQVLFALQNAPVSSFRSAGLQLIPILPETNVSKFDLSLVLEERSDGGLSGAFEYSTCLFQRSTIERLSEHYLRLLEAAVKSPHKPLEQISLISEEERRLQQSWNATAREYPCASLAEVFERAVREHSARPAVEFGDVRLTYGEFNSRVNRLAWHLREEGVGPESTVGISVRPGLAATLSMLAIIKAGGAYVPLPPSDPAHRRERMAKESGVAWVISEDGLPDIAGVRKILLDRDAPAIESCSAENPPILNGPDHLAYILYTSGSTGEPKGIAVPHRAVARLVLNTNYVELGPEDRLGQLATYAFDAITYEVWGALLNGGCVVEIPRNVSMSPDHLAAYLRERRITSTFMTAALFNQVIAERPDAFATMSTLLVGGEALTPHRVAECLKHGPPQRVLNGYGPTESTTFALWHHIQEVKPEDTTVPIGIPLANTTAYVLGPGFEPLPAGVVGELYLGGDGLARCYVQQPRLTGERFVPDPFIGRSGARMYRTGDRARRLADGVIECLGRVDDQVKLRGYRIELGEIESALCAHPEISQAAVVLRHDPERGKRLIGYVTQKPGARLTIAAIRQHIEQRVPDYMVPAALAILDRLPLNANGKVDKRRLPETDEDPFETPAQPVAPETEEERAVVDVWQSVLQHRSIGVNDNFFELGGDSITAIQVVSRLRNAGWQTQVQELLLSPTPRGLAATLQRPTAPQSQNDDAVGIVPLTPIQTWFFENHCGPLHHFNHSVLLRSDERINIAALRQALNALAKWHDILRARYRFSDGRVVQEVLAKLVDVPLEVLDLTASDETKQQIQEHCNHLQASLDLEQGPLFRAALIHLDGSERLLLIAHHLVVDGVSWRILLEDLERAYDQATSERAIDLGAKSTSFRRWSHLIREQAESPRILSQIGYWNSNARAQHPPRATPHAENTFGAARAYSVQLPPGQTALLLRDANRAYFTNANDLLLTALGRAFQQTWSLSRTWIALESHGREDIGGVDVSRTIGWFTSIYPFLLDVTDPSPGEQVERVKEALRAVPDHGLGYGILRYLTPVHLRSDAGWPAPRVSFNYLGQFGQDDSARFRFASESAGTPISPDLPRQHDVDIVALVSEGSLQVTFHHLPAYQNEQSVERLAERFIRQIEFLIDDCISVREPRKSPSDFTVRCLSPAEYKLLLNHTQWNPSEIEDVYPLSPLQSGLLFETVADADRQAYFVQVSYRIHGSLDLDLFDRSWRAIAQRHPVLRTAFVHDALDRPLQVVLRDRGVAFRSVDLTSHDSATQVEAIENFEAQDRARGFDLQREPLMRVAALQLAPDLCHIVWSYNHLLLDGWCVGILHHELLAHYQAESRGTTAVLAKPTPYSEYIRWLESWNRDAAKAFWSDYLSGYDEVRGVPREAITEAAERREDFRFEFDRATSTALRDVASKLGVTLNAVVQSIWGLILSRYNDAEDVVFGAVVSGRPATLRGVENIVGLFINAVPVRVRAGEQPFSSLAAELHRNSFEREPHQYLPISEIHSERSEPLFDHLLAFENYPLEAALSQPQDGIADFRIEGPLGTHDRTHYDFDIVVFPGDTIDLRIGYNATVFPPEQIQRIASHWREVSQAVIANAHVPLAEIDILPPAERSLVLSTFQGPQVECAPHTIVDAFVYQVRRNPHAPAVVFGPTTLTYSQLDLRADRIATGLRRSGISRGDRVALLLDRSDLLIASILGILKAGAAFVPVEPSYPADRIRYMLDDCGAQAVLIEDHYRDLCRDSSALLIDPRQFETELRADLEPPAPDDIAYLIYTSGSTGRPKGCVLSHANLWHYVGWAREFFYSSPDVGGSFPLFTPVSFDLTFTALFLPLARGKAIHVFPQSAQPDEVLAEVLRFDSRIDSLKLTPSHLALIPHIQANATGLRTVIVGGEALPLDRVRYLQALNPDIAIYNEYGPTETTVGCTVKRIDPCDRSVLIGSPISNTSIYIVDSQLRPCPIGVPGEILIGGPGLSRGYWNHDELTQTRFIETPLHPGGRLYRTGDIGRWLSNGDIDYLGRKDDQVKIRGHRVELGEIEAQMLAEAGVQQAVVLPSEDHAELLAWFVGDASEQKLRAQLGRNLPSHMIPSAFIRVETIPLTPNGKVDKRALLALKPDQQPVHRRPGDPVEDAIAAIWRDVLDVTDVDIDGNFFELGGHSLKAMQASWRIRQEFNVALTLKDFLDNPTISALSEKVRHARQETFSTIPLAPAQPDYPLSPAQSRLWLIDRIGGAGAAYNMPKAFEFAGGLSITALERAFNALLERHEALRTAMVEVDGEPRQRIEPRVDLNLQYTDLAGHEGAELEARQIADRDANTPFDLSRAPLLRARVIRVAPERHVLVLILHHIIGDGWSMEVIYRELLALYEAFHLDRSYPLKPPTIQYKDFALWQLQQPIRDHERYWLEQLDGVPQQIRLPYDLRPAAARRFLGATSFILLDHSLVQRLKSLAVRRRSTLANVVLAIFKVYLYRWTKQSDICVGLSVAGRNRPELENLVGFFVNLLPIRTRFEAGMDFDVVLDQIQRTSEEAFHRQDYPFDRLVQVLNPSRYANRQPLLNVVYAFQNFSDMSLDIGGTLTTPGQVADFPLTFRTSKFDLTLFATEDPQGLRLTMEYDSELFRPETIERALAAMKRLAQQISAEAAKETHA